MGLLALDRFGLAWLGSDRKFSGSESCPWPFRLVQKCKGTTAGLGLLEVWVGHSKVPPWHWSCVRTIMHALGCGQSEWRLGLNYAGGNGRMDHAEFKYWPGNQVTMCLSLLPLGPFCLLQAILLGDLVGCGSPLQIVKFKVRKNGHYSPQRATTPDTANLNLVLQTETIICCGLLYPNGWGT